MIARRAAGSVLEEAILQGFMELVECDSCALWWYNRVRRPAVDLASFDDPFFRRTEAFLRGKGRTLYALDHVEALVLAVRSIGAEALDREIDQARVQLAHRNWVRSRMRMPSSMMANTCASR